MKKLIFTLVMLWSGWLGGLSANAQVSTPIIHSYYDPYTGDWYRIYYNPDGSVKIEGGNVVTNNQFTQTTNIQGTTVGRDRLGNHWVNDENTGYTVLSNGIVCTGKGVSRTCLIPPTVPRYPIFYGAPNRLR